MWHAVAAGVDFVHAVLMAGWIAGLPLLFWHKWPAATRAFGVYAIGFVVASQASRWLLGECFLTTMARACWERAAASAAGSEEWFTVRLAQAVFHMAPSHRAVVVASEGLIAATALGVTWSLRRLSH
jgi:hypothetical protein